MRSEYHRAHHLMGKLVVVQAELMRHKTTAGVVTWDGWSVPERVGWVTGIRWKQEGHTEPGTSYSMSGWDMDGYDPPTFTQTVSVPVLLVVYWPTMNPVPVPFNGFRLAEPHEQPHPSSYEWSERDRQDLREITKDCPRDARGRFTKE